MHTSVAYEPHIDYNGELLLGEMEKEEEQERKDKLL